MHFLILLIQLAVFLFLLKQRSNKNKFHLDYFLAHIFCLILIILIYIPIKHLGFEITNTYFHLGHIFTTMSLIFIIFNIETSLKGYKVNKKKFIYFVAVVFTLCFLVFYSENYILNYSTRQTVFYDIKIPDPLVYNEMVFLHQGIKFILGMYLLIVFRLNIKKSINIKKKRIYSLWVYSLTICGFVCMVLNATLVYGFLDQEYDSLLFNIINIFIGINLIFFTLFPSVIFYSPLIMKVVFKDLSEDIPNFLIIKSFFDNEKKYLDQTLTLGFISKNTGLNEAEIRSCIKNNTNLNFNEFINQYRVNYAIKLMESGYLENHVMNSIAQKSGFNSPQTFYRAFKKFKSVTPAYYYKNLIAENNHSIIKMKE
jgi:AraC-like DNA-binding protein